MRNAPPYPLCSWRTRPRRGWGQKRGRVFQFHPHAMFEQFEGSGSDFFTGRQNEGNRAGRLMGQGFEVIAPVNGNHLTQFALSRHSDRENFSPYGETQMELVDASLR